MKTMNNQRCKATSDGELYKQILSQVEIYCYSMKRIENDFFCLVFLFINFISINVAFNGFKSQR